VARDKPVAAEKLAIRIVAAVLALRNYPYIGRVGADPEIRELVIGRTPYVVLYKVRGSVATINTIWHGAQKHES
jgi:toxin ParE1/3/4